MKLAQKFLHPGDGVKSVMLLGVYAVMLLYPATMFIQKEIKTEYFAALVFMSFYSFLSGRIRPSQYLLERKDYLVLFSFALITIIAWVSYAHFGFQEYAKHRVERYTWFLLAIPVYYLFLYTKPRMEVVWAGVVLGCFVAFGRAVLEELSLVDEIAWGNMKGRANGSMHPIRFGDLSLLMGCISLNGALNLTRLKFFFRVIGVVGFCAGVGASVMSESRGGWIALPIILLIIAWFKLRHAGERRKYFVLLFIAIFGGVAAIMSDDSTLKRIKRAGQEINLYIERGVSRTSVGSRFDMFQTAISAFSENLIFGVGVGGYHSYAVRYYEKYNLTSDRKLFSAVIRWKNPHNEYLLQASTRGVVGLAGFIFMMFSIIGCGYSRNAEKVEDGIIFSSVNLVIIGVGFGIFGLTIALFEHKDFLLFFLLYVSIFLAGLQSRMYPAVRR